MGMSSVCIEIHSFADASELSYARVVYLQDVLHIRTHMVTAKSKVVLIRKESIQRLDSVERYSSISVLSLLDEINEDLEVRGCLVFPCDGLPLFPHSWTKLRNHDRGENRSSFILKLQMTSQVYIEMHGDKWLKA